MSDLEKKCLEITQALVNQGQAFKFSITRGSFSLSLDTRGSSTKLVDGKKKKSPSQIRRNLKRREDFLKKKSSKPEESPKNPETNPEKDKDARARNKCNLCEKRFESDAGLKIHIGKNHKKETLRSTSSEVSPLKISPEKETPRECECCGEKMTTDHQCEPPPEEEEVEKEEFVCHHFTRGADMGVERCEHKSSTLKLMSDHVYEAHY